MAETASRAWGWIARGGGILVALFLGWWSLVLLRSSGGLKFLEGLDSGARTTVTSATEGLVVPEAPPQVAGAFGEIGVAFGVLILLGALVVLGASVFPYGWWRRRAAAR